LAGLELSLGLGDWIREGSFLIYINDLPNKLHTIPRLFADTLMIYPTNYIQSHDYSLTILAW